MDTGGYRVVLDREIGREIRRSLSEELQYHTWERVEDLSEMSEKLNLQ